MIQYLCEEVLPKMYSAHWFTLETTVYLTSVHIIPTYVHTHVHKSCTYAMYVQSKGKVSILFIRTVSVSSILPCGCCVYATS